MQYLDYEVKDRIAKIRLNRPERLNAMGIILKEEWRDAYYQFADDPDADVLIVTGAGRSFCAGRDMKEEFDVGLLTRGEEPKLPLLDGFRYVVKETTKPVIGAAHGYAVGAGAALLFGCDYRIASRDAIIYYAEVETGLPGPWDMASYHGIPWAMLTEIAMMGRKVPPERLYQIGLLNEVVERERLEERAMEVAQEFLKMPQDTVRATKELMIMARPWPPLTAIGRRQTIGEELHHSRSRTDAVESFVNKSETTASH